MLITQQMPLLIVAHPCLQQLTLLHLCSQARMSDESHLAPHPGLYITLIDWLVAWLQACPQPAYRTASRRSPAQQASQGAPMNSLMENMVTVQPHALDSHVPALCGPLQAGHSTSCHV